MKRIKLEKTCPESWKKTCPFDQAEIYGDGPSHGHTYGYQKAS